MEKWEYRIVWVSSAMKDDAQRNECILNQYGANGWELVSADRMCFYFKRRIG